MRTALLSVFLLVFAATGRAQQYTSFGEQDSVTVSYRWRHRAGKPSELWLKIANASTVRRQVHAHLDLTSKGVIVEQFEADTVMGPGRTLTGKLNGFYFIPRTMTPEQLQAPSTAIELVELRTPEASEE